MASTNGNNTDLLAYFNASDTDKNGLINAGELQRCLSNGTWKPFDIGTLRMMIALFDKGGRNAVNFHEFQDLITTWQQVFTSYDRDKALTLSAEQVHLALANSGYPLSTMLVEKLVKRYGGTQQSSGTRVDFDSFIHISILVQKITLAFSLKDKKQMGIIQLRYEEFIDLLFEHVLNSA